MSESWRNNQIFRELYLLQASLIILQDLPVALLGFKYSLSIYIRATYLHEIELKTGNCQIVETGPVRISL